jgi:CelD/BcsL family acetyltransferase involved in cellulose biosynthesis
MSDVNLNEPFGIGNTKVGQLTPKDKIEVDIYYSFDALTAIQHEWDNFIEEVGGEIFLTYDWCRTWWKYYGGKRDLAIFIFRDRGNICGIIPLFHEKLRIGPLSINVIKLVSSDYTPVAFSIAIKDDYIDQVVDLLTRGIHARWRSWHLLYIGAICGRYDNLENLVNAFKIRFGNKYRCELKVTDVQSYFSVAPSWEAQIANLVPKQRTNARRAFRETASKRIEISNHIASRETLAPMFENFVRMHQEHWQGIGRAGHFGAWPFAKEFHREIAEIQLELNRLRLIEIDFNGISVGYEYLYKLHDTYCWFLGARAYFEDNTHIDFKWIAFRAKIENAINDGVTTIDGMRGNYEYKLLMGGKTMPIRSLFIYSSRIPVRQNVFAFRLLSKFLHIIYNKIWRERVALRCGIKPKTFWDDWVRFHQLSA